MKVTDPITGVPARAPATSLAWTSAATPIAASARFVGSAAIEDADHRPILFSVGAGSARLDVLSWNVAYRYAARDDGKSVNNGFGRRDETIAAYRARLDRTAVRLEQMVRDEAPGVVIVQEATHAGDGLPGALARALTERLGPLGYTVTTSGELVTATKSGARRLVLPSDLTRQHGAMDAVLLDEPRAVVVNLHWRWDQRGGADEQATARDLRRVVQHLQQEAPGAPILFAGDANRAPPGVDAGDTPRIEDVVRALGGTDQVRVVPPPGPTNLRWDAERARSEPTYADCAVWIPPAVADASTSPAGTTTTNTTGAATAATTTTKTTTGATTTTGGVAAIGHGDGAAPFDDAARVRVGLDAPRRDGAATTAPRFSVRTLQTAQVAARRDGTISSATTTNATTTSATTASGKRSTPSSTTTGTTGVARELQAVAATLVPSVIEQTATFLGAGTFGAVYDFGEGFVAKHLGDPRSVMGALRDVFPADHFAQTAARQRVVHDALVAQGFPCVAAVQVPDAPEWLVMTKADGATYASLNDDEKKQAEAACEALRERIKGPVNDALRAMGYDFKGGEIDTDVHVDNARFGRTPGGIVVSAFFDPIV